MVITHKILGPVILLLVMLVVFQTIFSWANLPMMLIDEVFTALGEAARTHLPAGVFTDLLADGIIAGVGGVLAFLPQILLLFLFISMLEDSGYMARAAFLMDRLMRAVGLHGKAFVPLLSSFACAVPGIMATRTIENRKDRVATMHDRSFHELFGSPAGLHFDDCHILFRAKGPGLRFSWCGNYSRNVFAGDCGSHNRRLGFEAHHT